MSWPVRDPRTGREVDRPRFVPGSLREALRVQAELRAEVRERGRVQRTRLAAYARSWLARKRSALSVATLDRYAVALEDHILPVLGDWYIDAITPDACVAWRDEASARTYEVTRGEEREVRTYGARTVNGWLRVLRTVLADACVELRLGTSPASRLRALPEPAVYDDDDPNVLSAAELGALLVALRETAPGWYALVALMGLTGLRTSEATALRWTDIEGDVLTYWSGEARTVAAVDAGAWPWRGRR